MVLAASDSGFFGALHDIFGSDAVPIVRNLGIFLAVVFWLAVGYWVFKDARRRIEDPWLVGAATILGLIPPFIGALIYMLFRPPEYLEDVRERELEIKAMEESLGRGRASIALSAAPRSTRTSSSARCARRVCASPVRRARRRSSRCGRSARTARRRSRRRRRSISRRSKLPRRETGSE